MGLWGEKKYWGDGGVVGVVGLVFVGEDLAEVRDVSEFTELPEADDVVRATA